MLIFLPGVLSWREANGANLDGDELLVAIAIAPDAKRRWRSCGVRAIRLSVAERVIFD
jgi:hypothetical protein